MDILEKYITKRRGVMIKIIIIVLFAIFLNYMYDLKCASAEYVRGPRQLHVGMRVPDFTLQEQGRDKETEISLSRGSGSENSRPTIIMFWYLSCPDCISDIKHIKRLADKYNGKFTILTINVDSAEKRDTVLNFIKNQEMENFRNFFENIVEIGMERFFTTADRYGVLTTPSLFLITRDGYLKYKAEGEIDFDDFEYQMNKLISEQAVLNRSR